MSVPDLSAFKDVDLWIFDLDNTLYPRPDGLWAQVHEKMQNYIMTLLDLPRPEAARLQTDYFQQYGLTMRGLMLHHGVEPDAFNEHVHDVDLSDISANEDLGKAIAALPGRRIIHSNANMGHVNRVLDRLGMADVFDAAYDIGVSDYHPKPAEVAYKAVLSAEGADPDRAAMFEDISHNLVVPHALGMCTVMVPSHCEWASQGADGEHIHFVANDLTAFVKALTEERIAA